MGNRISRGLRFIFAHDYCQAPQLAGPLPDRQSAQHLVSILLVDYMMLISISRYIDIEYRYMHRRLPVHFLGLKSSMHLDSSHRPVFKFPNNRTTTTVGNLRFIERERIY